MTSANDYTGRMLAFGKRAYRAAFDQRKKDITMPHPLTGANIEEPWYYFERMFRGFHYDFVNRMATWASMPVANKIFAGIEAYSTMLCDSKPAITIVPREITDERLSNIAKAGMTYWWDEAAMENTISVTVKASRIFGLGWFHTYWDPEKKNMVCESVHPAHVLVDPNCTAGNFDPEYLIYEYKGQYGALKDRYNGKTLPDGSIVDFTAFSRNRQWELQSWSPDQSDERWKDPLADSTTVNVYELHYKDPNRTTWEDEDVPGLVTEKSKKKYPRGRVVTIAGGMVIDDRENPYLHGEIPFTPVHAYIIPGRFYGIGDVQMGMNTQIMRNRFAQLIIDMTMKSGGGWMFLGQGSGLKPSQISQGPFNVVPCKDVNQIRIDRPPGPSRAMFDFIQVLDMDFDDAMGIHEISRGATLTSHKTAQEISVMAESDRTRVRQAARNLIWSLKRVARQVMWGLAQYHEGDWFVRIAGDPKDIAPVEDENGNIVEEEKRYEDVDFNGKMFLDSDGSSLKYDIVFADDATLPNSQSETFSKIEGLLGMGVITPEDVLKYKLVDIPYSDQIYLDHKQMVAQQEQMAQEQPAPTEEVPPGAPPAGPVPGGPGGEQIPPELLAMLMGGGGGLPPGAAPGPMGDPVSDMLMAQGGPPVPPDTVGMPPNVPPDMGNIDPALLAQLTGGAAVPSAPIPGVDPLQGLGTMPPPSTGIDPSLLGAMTPPVQNLSPEQVQQLAELLAEKYGLPVQLILDVLFQIIGSAQGTTNDEVLGQEEIQPTPTDEEGTPFAV